MWRVADWAEVADAFKTLTQRPELLSALLVSYTAAFVPRAVAWGQLMTSKAGVFDLFTYPQAALLAKHLLPFKFGEVVRPLLASRRGDSLSDAAATTAVARLPNSASLIVIAAAGGLLLSLPAGRILWPQSLALPRQ